MSLFPTPPFAQVRPGLQCWVHMKGMAAACPQRLALTAGAASLPAAAALLAGSKSTSDACTGDSGGPLLTQDSVVVVSLGAPQWGWELCGAACSVSESLDGCISSTAALFTWIPSDRCVARTTLTAMQGLVSFGPDNCGGDGHIGAYTDVASLQPWIVSVMEEEEKAQVGASGASSGEEEQGKGPVRSPQLAAPAPGGTGGGE